MSCGQAEIHAQFAEDLWLLRKLRSSTLTSTPEICREAYQRLVLSDTIALYLTTDDQDGVVAACYMPQDAMIFLAKSGSSDSSYEAESTVFFRELANANGFEDLLPFLARRSCNRVNKRIRKLRHYYKMFEAELFIAATKYEPTDTEFSGPWYRKFVQISRAENQPDTPSSKQILLHVLTFCKDQLGKNLEFSDKPESHRPFAALLYAASVLLNSDFYSLMEHEDGYYSLGRQLEKITEYLRVSRLIKVWRRYGRDTNIKWITDVQQSDLPRTLATEGVGERHLEAVFQRNVHQCYRPYIFKHMDQTFPGWRGETSETKTFVPCMHAEIRLILHLMGSFANFQTPRDETIPIGCGQRSCFACTLWITEFNRVLRMKWTTRYNNGQPRYDCALPRAEAVVRYVGVEGYHRITSYVHQGTTDAIREVINKESGDAVEDYMDDYCRSLRNSS
ncbi:hypothetical protein C0993_003892 [Termitomyces sp. T159_Od127]|nr:hypothetical protein C0993_003892 [Termitomyces sp. T159_Od127]